MSEVPPADHARETALSDQPVSPCVTDGIAPLIAKWRAYVQHKPECAALQCSHCGGLLAAHRPTGRHAAISGPCTCGFADLEAALVTPRVTEGPMNEKDQELESRMDTTYGGKIGGTREC